MQNIKIAPTFFYNKSVVKIKNVKNVKKRDINKKRKKSFLHLWFGPPTPSGCTHAIQCWILWLVTLLVTRSSWSANKFTFVINNIQHSGIQCNLQSDGSAGRDFLMCLHMRKDNDCLLLHSVVAEAKPLSNAWKVQHPHRVGQLWQLFPVWM